MKRLINATIVFLFALSVAWAGNSRFPNGLTVGTETQEGSATIGIGDGNLYVAGNIEVGGGLVNVSEVFFDVPAASSITYISGFDTLGTISTTTLVSAGTSYSLSKGDYSNTPYPRNVTANITLDAGTSTTTVTGVLVISGVDNRGNSVTETLIISTTTATGSRAWNSITSLTVSVTAISPTNSTNAHINIGSGLKIGLANNISSASNILKVNEATTATTAYTLDTTYDTITFVNAPDGSKDYKVIYRPISK